MKEAERVSLHIRTAFELLKERMHYEYGQVDLNKAVICASYYSELAEMIEVCGMKVYLCNLQSSYDYFLCIEDPNKYEIEFLKCHVEVMQQEG